MQKKLLIRIQDLIDKLDESNLKGINKETYLLLKDIIKEEERIIHIPIEIKK